MCLFGAAPWRAPAPRRRAGFDGIVDSAIDLDRKGAPIDMQLEPRAYDRATGFAREQSAR
jgi:hypothetical protein